MEKKKHRMIGIIPAFFPLKQLTENYKQIKPAEEIDLLNIDSDGACSLILFQVELHDN